MILAIYNLFLTNNFGYIVYQRYN